MFFLTSGDIVLHKPNGATMSSAGGFGPGKLWSLWDIMMNYGVFGLCFLLRQLASAEWDLISRIQMAESAKGPHYANELMKFLDANALSYAEVNNLDMERIKGLIQFAQQQADTMELQGVHDRLEIFNRKLLQKISLHDFLAEIRALREAFESGLRYKRFYLYPEAKGQLCIKAQDHWAKVISAFPNAKDDVLAAVDCYGLGHNTASVFYSMRVVEHGLRELAAAVNIEFGTQQWHTVIEAIESAVREIGDRWRASTVKSDWMSFYSVAAKEFFYFKDGWRNYVSHGGDPYDEHQALGVLEHVRTFMTHLASRFDAGQA
jgi:hypothetical protein